jgi:pimeloyl-ACP methyl ester carboxylesterase
MLALYTDGLIEQPGQDISTGMSRLARALTASPARSLDQVCDGVLATIGARARDDIALLLVRTTAETERRYVTLRQKEMAWYQLFFQFEGIAEATIQHDDWAWLRAFSRGDGDLDRWIADLARPGALTASLSWARANLAPRMPEPPKELPPVKAPPLGIWSTGDHYLEGQRFRESGTYVQGPWRYEQIDGASHWIPLDAPGRLNDLLLEWLG